MADDLTVEQSFRFSYQQTFQLVAQQTQSKFRQFVTEIAGRGPATAAADLVGDVEMQERNAKDRKLIEVDPFLHRRWLMMRKKFSVGKFIDSVDTLRQITSPTSEYIRAFNAAGRRQVDRIILGVNIDGSIGTGGLLGAVVEGETPSTTVAFPSSQVIAAGGTGLTMAKLKAVREQFAKADYDLDMESPVMAIDPTEMTDLLGIVEAAGSSINLAEQAQMIDGKVKRFMNMNFLESNRLPLNGTTRGCVAWMPSNIVLGVWEEISGDVFNVPSSDNEPYVKVQLRMDCTRKEDSGVIKVECAE